MRRISPMWIVGLLVLSVTAGALARSSSTQAPARPPTPDSPGQSAELKVLDIWRGNWTTQGKLYDTPYSHAGEVTMTIRCDWSAYGGYMICDHLVNGPNGKRNDLSISTYNPADQVYKFCGLDRTGTPSVTPLKIEGKVWSYDRDEEEKGQKIHIKTINDFSKPGVVTWNTKYTADGGAHWTLMNEGVDTKQP